MILKPLIRLRQWAFGVIRTFISSVVICPWYFWAGAVVPKRTLFIHFMLDIGSVINSPQTEFH